jgi:predicted nucleic acid-binding protein
MIVVADTSPLNYLVRSSTSASCRSYMRAFVPPAVLTELSHPSASRAVREFAANGPGWLEVVAPKNPLKLANLDPGESQAIALAAEIGAGAVLIDDRAGRREALRRGLAVAGALSVLDDADEAGLLKFDDAVARLRNTSFRLSSAVLNEIMRKRSS